LPIKPKNGFRHEAKKYMEENTMKNLLIEWRHLDIDGETCNRCYDTGENLAAEVKRLNRALNPQGIEVKYKEIKLNKSQVPDSNEILFNNVPLEKLLDIEVSQNYCGSCSDLTGETTYCRTIKYEGNEYEDIPAKAIRQAAYKVLGLNEKTTSTSSCCAVESDCGCGCESALNDFWHPIINTVTCTECGKCVDKCSRGVYDKNSLKKPVIINAESCKDGCHGCGDLCPTGSITYNKENTDWVPPNAPKKSSSDCGCKTGCCQ
jgi:NAD-dependent dihydropyrimidine dehydrogenase PreA subunit